MQARCSGCDYEGSPRRVESHQRSCEGFSELYRRDPALALVNPVDVYAAAHVVAPDDQLVEATAGTIMSTMLAEASASGSLVEAGTEVVARSRRARKAKSVTESSVRVAGPVTVEYWDWQLTMLEELQAST